MTILEAVKKSGCATLLWGGSMQQAQAYLHPNEPVLAAVTGNIRYQQMGQQQKYPFAQISGVTVFTGTRLFFYNYLLKKHFIKEILLPDITNITLLPKAAGAAILKVESPALTLQVLGNTQTLAPLNTALTGALQQHKLALLSGNPL
ncbi:hypothetical protein LJC61_08230 [Ruminococcaceae bacterium OttesenSCG-928-A16]|nr:hypothetical protein [Ruminococcaceae bacterium OttesenSCG-928-A16]